MPRIVVSCLALALVNAHAGDAPVSHTATVLGPLNPALTAGTRALELGRYEEGVRLTLEGLELPNNPQDRAAAHSNVCAGLAALKRWHEALEHCNRALSIDRNNWRTYNNRAAVFVGLRKYDLAVTDVNSGLEIAPASSILLKSREVVEEHRQAAVRDRKRRPQKA
jgi:tetratricopeptide (TPR) repeat protein